MIMAFLTLVIGTLTFFGAWCDCPLLQRNLYLSISGFYGICCATVLAFLITRSTLEAQQCGECPLAGMDIKRRDECTVNGTDWSNKQNYINIPECWYFGCDKICIARHPKLVTSVTLTAISIAIYGMLTLIGCVCLHDKQNETNKNYGSVALRQDNYSDGDDELVIVDKKQRRIPKKFVIKDEEDSSDEDGEQAKAV